MRWIDRILWAWGGGLLVIVMIAALSKSAWNTPRLCDDDLCCIQKPMWIKPILDQINGEDPPR